MDSVFVKILINESHIGLKDVFVIDVDGNKLFGDIEHSNVKASKHKFNVRHNGGVQLSSAKYILKEIELPSEDDIIEKTREITKNSFDSMSNYYCKKIANFILNKLKEQNL